MAIGGVVINFAARTREAVRDVNKLTGELGDLGRKTENTGSKLKTGLKAGALAAAGAVASLGGVMWDAAKAAQEDWQQSEKLADVLRTVPGITQDAIDANEEWISSTQLATNILDTDLRDAIGRAVLVTNDLGEAQRIAAAAVDLAAVTGKDYSTVAEAMAKAAAGNTTQLKRMAPWLDANGDGTLTLAEAMGELETKHRDAAEQVADRDPFTRFQIVLDEIQETLGTGLLPYLQDFGTWMSSEEGQQAIRDMGKAAADFAKGIASIATAFARLRSEYNRLPEWVRKMLGSGFSPVWEAPQKLWNTRPWRNDPVKITSPSNPQNNRGQSVTINNYYPKPERASATVAGDIRLAQKTGGR
jgi:hypothetical protein